MPTRTQHLHPSRLAGTPGSIGGGTLPADRDHHHDPSTVLAIEAACEAFSVVGESAERKGRGVAGEVGFLGGECVECWLGSFGLAWDEGVLTSQGLVCGSDVWLQVVSTAGFFIHCVRRGGSPRLPSNRRNLTVCCLADDPFATPTYHAIALSPPRPPPHGG
jgi:hypothetical protein